MFVRGGRNKMIVKLMNCLMVDCSYSYELGVGSYEKGEKGILYHAPNSVLNTHYSFTNFFTATPSLVFTSTIYTPLGNAETSTLVLPLFAASAFNS
jgi:hypothetical protein